MKKAVIVGGANGIGLSVALELKGYDRICIIDKEQPAIALDNKYCFEQFNLNSLDYSIFDKHLDASLLMITAGFGRLALFSDINEQYIIDSFNVNTIAAIRIIKHFYDRLLRGANFRCGIMVSIAGFMSSPFFSVYAASKAALKIFIESVNVELEKAGSSNRILNVSPGSIAGTRFNGGDNNIDKTRGLAQEIISHLEKKDDLFIPDYDEVYSKVLERYHQDFRKEGLHSYDYKVTSGRVK